MTQRIVLIVILCTLFSLTLPSNGRCQATLATLDSTQSDVLVSLIEQLGTPFIAAAKSYQVEKKKWPADSSALISYTALHKDNLNNGRFNSVKVWIDSGKHFLIRLDVGKAKIRFGQEQWPSMITNLVGTIQVQTLTKAPDGVTLFITVNDAAVTMYDRSKAEIHKYTQVLARVIKPKY